jgi:AcrR family transcriptional regulator
VVNAVKPSARRDRARATRLRIIEASALLFAEAGYAGTTMEAIARAAGVAVQTVYFVFHTKGELLIETMSVLAWGPEPRSEAARGWIQLAFETSGGARQLAIAVDAGAEVYRRAAPLFGALIAASSVDPEVRAAWQWIVDERRAGMSRLIELIHGRGELREGVSSSYAADVMVGLHRHELFLAFTLECGWSVETYKAWLFATLCRQLLPDEVAAAALEPGSPATAGTSFKAALRDLPS